MLKHAFRKFKAAGARSQAILAKGMDTPEAFALSERYMFWHDGGVMRCLGPNLADVGPGLSRSNQPDFRRLEAFKAAGGQTVLSLRGPAPLPCSTVEEAWCRKLGLTFKAIHMEAKTAPPRLAVLDLISVFETAARPMLVHCRSGADRTGLAAAVYKLHFDGASVAEAQKQLSFRYFHVRKSGAGVQGHVLDWYDRRLTEKGPIPFRDWIASEYDPAEVQASFDAMRKKR